MRGTCWGPNMDGSILVSILGVPYFGKLPFTYMHVLYMLKRCNFQGGRYTGSCRIYATHRGATSREHFLHMSVS